jgi:hypothetical protein
LAGDLECLRHNGVETDHELANDPFLDIKVPTFVIAENGYLYEKWRWFQTFYGPYKIMLEDGHYVEIKPKATSKPPST